MEMEMNLQAWVANLGHMTPRDIKEELGLARGWLAQYKAELANAQSETQRALKVALVAQQEKRLAYLQAL